MLPLIQRAEQNQETRKHTSASDAKNGKRKDLSGMLPVEKFWVRSACFNSGSAPAFRVPAILLTTGAGEGI
jgi:hypothetical protein